MDITGFPKHDKPDIRWYLHRGGVAITYRM